MIDLYYAPTPNGWKISIMLEELGLPCNVIPVNIRAGEQFRPDGEGSLGTKMTAVIPGRHEVASYDAQLRI